MWAWTSGKTSASSAASPCAACLAAYSWAACLCDDRVECRVSCALARSRSTAPSAEANGPFVRPPAWLADMQYLQTTCTSPSSLSMNSAQGYCSEFAFVAGAGRGACPHCRTSVSTCCGLLCCSPRMSRCTSRCRSPAPAGRRYVFGWTRHLQTDRSGTITQGGTALAVHKVLYLSFGAKALRPRSNTCCTCRDGQEAERPLRVTAWTETETLSETLFIWLCSSCSPSGRRCLDLIGNCTAWPRGLGGDGAGAAGRLGSCSRL